MSETAIFAAGCFWKPEAMFASLKGVEATEVGYTGGHTENPSYEQVCSGQTGHAEAVKVTFDPDRISFGELMDAFWSMHDPTQKNRQGPDIGTQYRSAVFAVTPEQKRTAQESLKQLADSGRFNRPVQTEIVDAGPFYRAEEYHQKYFEKRGVAV
jgi:methionine-S-sulfoxide reductase